ncbi:2-oxoacid:acceptor oxidoreductase family protein [bacterium]|nr:2-oxoacid:acceptor oxidoreductase family protein [bacterium]
MKLEIRFSGSGGQGLITAARVIAKCAVLDKNNALQSQTYGSEARGGATKSEVILSSEKIYFPEVLSPDIVLVTTQEAYQKYGINLVKTRLVIIDSFSVKDFSEKENWKVIALPFTGLADKEFHHKILMNMMISGFLVGILHPILTIESFKIALQDFFSDEKLEKNRLASQYGFEQAIQKNLHF